MYTVHKKPHGSNLIWNHAKNEPLLEFKNGVFETEDRELAKLLLSRGYIVDNLDDTNISENVENVSENNKKPKSKKQ